MSLSVTAETLHLAESCVNARAELRESYKTMEIARITKASLAFQTAFKHLESATKLSRTKLEALLTHTEANMEINK
jgi:hypothetical protein